MKTRAVSPTIAELLSDLNWIDGFEEPFRCKYDWVVIVHITINKNLIIIQYWFIMIKRRYEFPLTGFGMVEFIYFVDFHNWIYHL